jgi:hypothetical protein
MSDWLRAMKSIPWRADWFRAANSPSPLQKTANKPTDQVEAPAATRVRTRQARRAIILFGVHLGFSSDAALAMQRLTV